MTEKKRCGSEEGEDKRVREVEEEEEESSRDLIEKQQAMKGWREETEDERGEDALYKTLPLLPLLLAADAGVCLHLART